MDPRPSNFEEGDQVRKGPWTMEEDMILINYISTHGEGVWNSVARCAGLKRTGKSCRLRWLNYLRPDVRRGNITHEEHLLIMELHAKWGNRWSKIAKQLPGRTDNEIKNFWRTRIQKHNTRPATETSIQLQSSTSEQTTEQLAPSSSQMSDVANFHGCEIYSPPSYPENIDNFAPQFSTEYQHGNMNIWNMEEDLWSMQLFSED